MRKLTLLIAFGLGYVLGAKAGRERYGQIMGTVDKVRQDPRVQEKAHQVADTARQHAPVVADKVSSAATSAAAAAKDKVGGGSSSHEINHMAGPQGDLP